jgi:hypothetical protein
LRRQTRSAAVNTAAVGSTSSGRPDLETSRQSASRCSPGQPNRCGVLDHREWLPPRRRPRGAAASTTGTVTTCWRVPSLADTSYTWTVPCWVRPSRYGTVTDQLPRQPLPQVAVVNRVAIERTSQLFGEHLSMSDGAFLQWLIGGLRRVGSAADRRDCGGRSKLRGGPTTDLGVICRTALSVLEKFELRRPVRLLGVRADLQLDE